MVPKRNSSVITLILCWTWFGCWEILLVTSPNLLVLPRMFVINMFFCRVENISNKQPHEVGKYTKQSECSLSTQGIMHVGSTHCHGEIWKYSICEADFVPKIFNNLISKLNAIWNYLSNIELIALFDNHMKVRFVDGCSKHDAIYLVHTKYNLKSPQ